MEQILPMERKTILKELDSVMHERLFSAIKRLSINEKKEKYQKTSDYENAESPMKKTMLTEKYNGWFKSADTFYLSLHSIFGLYHLVKREREIQAFSSQKITVVKINYSYQGFEFSASYGTRFTVDNQKEASDCIEELNNPDYFHLVDNYKPVKDAEKTPPEPITNAMLKYSGFYLFQFEYKYTTALATLLYNAGLITEIDTNGWEIDDEICEELITILNSKYNESQVLQRKRTFQDTNVDRTQECIRPTHFSKEYFPKHVIDTNKFNSIDFENEGEKADAKKLYAYIFYMTLSTQMTNSIYDNSLVDIQVGPKMLKQKANDLIEGQDNWELLAGNYIKKLRENDESDEGEGSQVILPEFKHGEELNCLNVYPFEYSSRRPRRYGVGRFASQILEKYNISSSEEHDEIINNLKETKAVIQIHQVLNPQEISLFFYAWIEEYMPLLIDLEYLSELEDKIDLVTRGGLTVDSIKDELDRMIDDGFAKAGYVENNNIPSQAKINLIKAIAAKHNLDLDAEMFESSAKCDILLSHYPTVEPIKVAHCPNCNAVVFQKEFIIKDTGEVKVFYACEKFSNKGAGCNFSIWDDKVNKFFTDKKHFLYTVKERREALAKILKRKRGYLFSGLENEKDGSIYEAKIKIDQFSPKDSPKVFWFLKIAKKEKLKPGDKKAKEESRVSKPNSNFTKAREIRTVETIKPVVLSESEIAMKKKIAELESQTKKLKEKNLIDHLTGAHNREALDVDMKIFWDKGLGSHVSIAFLDGDKFKDINDTYGHDGGDEVLKEFVRMFKVITDTLKARVYKFGGDEFCILFREDHEVVKSAMQSVRAYVNANPIPYNDKQIPATFSAGVALAGSYETPKHVLIKADEMLYESKEAGRNQIAFGD